MKRERFRRGSELVWRNRQFVVERRTENGEIQIRDISNNDYLTFPDSELIDALFAGELEIVNRNVESGKLPDFVDDLSLLPENKREEAKRRYSYVQRCCDKGITKITKKVFEPIIKEVAEEINDSKPPAWISVYRWYKYYTKSSQDIRSLISKLRKGNTLCKFGKQRKQKFTAADRNLANETAKVVEDVINEKFMTSQRLSVQATYDSLLIRLAEINRFRSTEEKLPIPHPDSIYTNISKMDGYEKDRARLGKRIADQKHLQRGIGLRPTRPLERIEIDHTKVDLFVVDDRNRLPIGRPTITTAIDKFSGMIVGRYVCFEPPGSQSVFQCLLHAIRPKTYLRKLFINILNDWETFGLPETIACDNGLEFLGGHYADACLQLGINIDYSPVRQPWYKSTIERFFGTQNRKLLHRMPGTSFSNIFDKGDYDPKANAVISFSAFLEILDTWIVDIYSQEIRRGYEQTGPRNIPALTWREGIEKYPPALPNRNLDLDILLRMIEFRTIDSGGIELFSLLYNDSQLALIRRELQGKKVMVKYDPSDLSLIYVADTKKGTYIPVPALDQNYTKGLSLYQHEIIKKFTRNYLKSQINSESLIEAKSRVQQIVDHEFNLTKKTRTRVQAARFQGINSKEKSKSATSAEDHRNYIETAPLPMLPPANIAEAGIFIPDDEFPVPDSKAVKSAVIRKSKKKLSLENDNVDISQPPSEIENVFEENDVESETPDLSGWGGGFDLPKRK